MSPSAYFCQYQISSVALECPGVGVLHIMQSYLGTLLMVSTCLVIIMSTVEVMSGFCFCMSFQSIHTNSLSSWKRHSIRCSYTQLVLNQWACITSHTTSRSELSFTKQLYEPRDSRTNFTLRKLLAKLAVFFSEASVAADLHLLHDLTLAVARFFLSMVCNIWKQLARPRPTYS